VLRLLVDETVGERVLSPHASAFLTAHSSLCIEWMQQTSLAGGKRADADLVLQYAPARSVGARVQKLGVQRLLTCAAPQYVRERGVPHHPRDLVQQGHEGIVASDGPSGLSGWRFAEGDRRLNIGVHSRAVVPSISTALTLALGGAGVVQIPECWGVAYVRSGQLIRLLPDWEESLHLWAIQPRGAQDLEIASLLRFIRKLVDMGAPERGCYY
jgi:DNA-binding transcriptional LysR family regulator